MTPEQRDEMKLAMQRYIDNPAETRLCGPEDILSLIAQVEAGNRKSLELQRVYDERGLQIDRLEVALQRARSVAAATDAWRYRARKYGGVWAATGNDVMIKRMLEIDPEFWEIEQLFAPTIAAIPGTKEGA